MKTILIADDELSIRILVQATLENPDARIVQATNGNEALQFAIAELPDAIVLDWMMPGLSGLDVLKALRLRTDTPRGAPPSLAWKHLPDAKALPWRRRACRNSTLLLMPAGQKLSYVGD